MEHMHKLGKRAARVDGRTLKLSKYVKKLPAPPDDSGYVDKVPFWPMMLNDQLGDCTVAAAGHMIQQWSTYANQPYIPRDVEVLCAYMDVGGYETGKPETDNGAVMLDVLNYWRRKGIGGHKIKAFVSLDPRNSLEIKQAVWLFGNCYVGVGLPVSAMNPILGHNGKQCWAHTDDGPDGEPWSWGGHAVPIVGYGQDDAGHRGTMLVTWGELYDMTWDFMRTYCDEAYAVLSEDWFDKACDCAPSGFDLATLERDLAEITK